MKFNMKRCDEGGSAACQLRRRSLFLLPSNAKLFAPSVWRVKWPRPCTSRAFASKTKTKPLPPDHHPDLKFDRRAHVAERARRRRERLAQEAPESLESTTPAPTDSEPAEKPLRLPKRKCAVLLGFCGTGFNGMQYHPIETGIITVESTLFAALSKTGAVSADNSDDPFKIGLQRAARTDAGVHALGNLVSGMLILRPNMVAAINDALPPNVRVWAVMRVQNGFNAHTSCESRYYSYTFPTYLLRPPREGSFMHAQINDLPPPNSRAGRSFVVDDDTERFQYRVQPEAMDNLRALLPSYVGRRLFHNFTPDVMPGDMVSRRSIYSIDISDPFERGGVEWSKITIFGQSFMMHQIRKMVGTLLVAARTGTPLVTLRALTDRRAPGRAHTPRAPAPGLILERPTFDGYNTRLDKDIKPNAAATPHITFEPFTEQMEALREAWVWPGLLAAEPMFAQWMDAVDEYDGPDLSYFGPRAGARLDDPPPQPEVLDSTTSHMELLGDDGRVRFLYLNADDGSWRCATIPTHQQGWRDRRFLDHIADSRGRARLVPTPVGVEAEADARAAEGAELGRVDWETARARAVAFHAAKAES